MLYKSNPLSFPSLGPFPGPLFCKFPCKICFCRCALQAFYFRLFSIHVTMLCLVRDLFGDLVFKYICCLVSFPMIDTLILYVRLLCRCTIILDVLLFRFHDNIIPSTCSLICSRFYQSW